MSCWFLAHLQTQLDGFPRCLRSPSTVLFHVHLARATRRSSWNSGVLWHDISRDKVFALSKLFDQFTATSTFQPTGPHICGPYAGEVLAFSKEGQA